MAPKSDSALREGELELGHISGVFGVRGEVRLFLHNPESDLFRTAREVILLLEDGSRHTRRLKARSGAGKRVLGRLDGVTTPEQARDLMGARIVVAREALPDVGSDEFYFSDVIGVGVFVDGEQIGTLVEIHASGPIDVLEILTDDGPEFVPAVRDLVVSVSADGVVLKPGSYGEDEE